MSQIEIKEIKNKNLLTITEDINRIESQIIATGGELTEDLERELNEVGEMMTKKVDAYDFRIKGLNARAEMFKAKADEFTRVARSMVEFSDRLKENIKHAMIERGTTELVGETVRFKISSTKPRTVIDDKALPHYYMMILHVPDKEKISEAVKNEIEVPGVTLEQGWQLRTYPNTGK